MTAIGFTHCPNCLAEYRAGYTLCQDCGSLLVPGPSPAVASTDRPPGSVEIADGPPDEPSAADRFAREETPIVLVSIVDEDVDAFLAALEDQRIGARRGAATDDGGVEILIHESNLADAQAVLVDFTGDVQLVDEIGLGSEVDGATAADDLSVVTWTPIADAGVQANRLRDRGLDVRIEIPTDVSPGVRAAILVPANDLAEARAILGIEA